MPENKKIITHNDKSDLLREASGLLEHRLNGESRRRFLKMGLTLGGIALLTGCDISDNGQAEEILNRMSRINDRLQGMLFSQRRLAPVYKESQITRPFPFNAFYGEDDIPKVNGDNYQLALTGLIQDKRPWTLSQLYNLHQVSQITRHICVEGWSAIGRWDGIPFNHFLQAIGADLSAKYVSFKCEDDYYTSIDMATALHRLC